MRGKQSGFLSTILYTISDFTLDKAVQKFDEYKISFVFLFIAGIFQIILSFFVGFELSFISFLVSFIYTFAMICAYRCYLKAIDKLPISLVSLIESGDMFLVLICDLFLGYISLKPIFFVLFIIFFLAIYTFTKETEKMKDEIKAKKIDIKAVSILIISIIFYASEPYFIKLMSSKGANEVAINIMYSIIAVPYFYYLYRKNNKVNKQEKSCRKNNKWLWWALFIGITSSVGDYFYMKAFVLETPIIIYLINKLKVFLLVILAVVTKSDKMNLKKVISLLVGMAAIIILTIIS